VGQREWAVGKGGMNLMRLLESALASSMEDSERYRY
jgi:hypothetical protein